MLMVSFARGQGSGRVDRQCSNFEVSSGGIMGSSRWRAGALQGLLRSLLWCRGRVQRALWQH